jgi:Domain of unknown function (DUF6429)
MEIEIDEEKVDEVVLALLYLTTFKDKPYWRAWKSHDWDSLDRLHQRGYISDRDQSKISRFNRGRCQAVAGSV